MDNLLLAITLVLLVVGVIGTVYVVLTTPRARVHKGIRQADKEKKMRRVLYALIDSLKEQPFDFIRLEQELEFQAEFGTAEQVETLIKILIRCLKQADNSQ